MGSRRITRDEAREYIENYFPAITSRRGLLDEMILKLKAEQHSFFEKDLRIFNLAYGLSGEEPLFWREIGERVGVSGNRARVRFNRFVQYLKLIYNSMTVSESIKMTPAQREMAMSFARYAGGKIPNGPTAGDLFKAAMGQNEHLLLAIHCIIDCHENNREQADAID